MHKRVFAQNNKVTLWLIKLFVRLYKNIYLRLVSSLLYQLTEDDVAMRRIIRSLRLHLCASQCIACVRYSIPRKYLNGNVADISKKLSVMQMLLPIFCLLYDESFLNKSTPNLGLPHQIRSRMECSVMQPNKDLRSLGILKRNIYFQEGRYSRKTIRFSTVVTLHVPCLKQVVLNPLKIVDVSIH